MAARLLLLLATTAHSLRLAPTALRARPIHMNVFEKFGDNMKQLTDQRVARVSHIMLPTTPENVEQLAAWKAEISNDEEKFSARAKESSTCRSAASGGSLGFITRGKLGKEFDSVIFEEEPGFVYGPTQTPFGHSIIFVHTCREPKGAKSLFPQ